MLQASKSMSKRPYIQVATDSDDGDPQASQSSSKRARRAHPDDRRSPQSVGRGGKSKGKARAVESDGEQEDDNEDTIEINEFVPRAQRPTSQEEFERLHGEKLQAKLESKRQNQVPGGIAEHGIIEYIEMHQFMCHRFLKFNFGPQINFIIGHNGSGKSAVLSAITVALGGKSTSTGRGTGLKSFIREGQSAAEVSIHIKNQGEEAYKPDEYGKTIIITRCFTKDGSATWKIKNANGKVISTKREELSAIREHMNIQVDNPVNILTQDSARQFLASSSPKDKYNMFLKATLLQQLSDEYDLCSENIGVINKLLMVKRAALPDLRARKHEALAKYNEATKAREQKEKVEDLKKELAWSYVAAKGSELESQAEKVARLSSQLPEIANKVKETKAQFDSANERFALLEQEKEGLEDSELTRKKKAELQDKMRRNKTELKKLNGEIASINQSLGIVNEEIAGLEHDIENEANRMATVAREKQEETQTKLEAARQDVKLLEANIGDLREEKKGKGTAAHTVKRQLDDLRKTSKELRVKIDGYKDTIAMVKKRGEDALIPYGKNIKSVLEKIKASRWRGDMPLGPLGLYVSARDPETWGELLRSQLGRLLVGYAITDPKDRPQLRQILQECGNIPVPAILIHKKDLFEYSSGEPPQEYLTVLRALQINNEQVKCILINHFHIESRLLTHKRDEAAEILKKIRSTTGSAWSLDKMFLQVYSDEGSFSTPINFKVRGAMNLLLTRGNSADELQRWDTEKRQTEEQYKNIAQQLRNLTAQHVTLEENIKLLEHHENTLLSQLHEAQAQLNALQQEAYEELPAVLAGIQEAKEKALAEKQSYVSQFKDLAIKKAAIDEEQKGFQDQLNALRKCMDEDLDRRTILNERLAAASELRHTAENEQKHYETRYAEKRQEVHMAEEKVLLLQEEFANWRNKALQYCEEIPDPCETEDVKRQLESVEKALRDRERIHGDSIEDTSLALRKASENLKKAMTDLRQLTMLCNALQESLIIRQTRWDHFRMYMALRCKYIFQYHISMRGYYGKALFNHENKELIIHVRKEDQLTQKTLNRASKDLVNGLSGGEKSFSTISLLQALWDCVGCPLRCLDEFDVFMDAVNRRTSMKLLIDTANTSDKKQYIFITPQNMSNVTMGSSVQVLRMLDPERGTGMLSFASS